MATSIKIGKKAGGVRARSASGLNRLRINTMPGYAERGNLVSSSVTAEFVASVLDQSTRGNLTRLHELFDKMELDPQIGGLSDQMKRTLAGAQVKPEVREGFNAEEKRLAEDYFNFICLMNAQIDTRALIKEFVAGYMRGVKAFQVEYKIATYGGKRFAIPKSIKPVAGQRYLWETAMNRDTFGELKIITARDGDGVPVSALPQSKIFVVSDGHGHARWDLNGVYRRAISFWLLKMYAVSWWGDKVEVFGEPIRVARVPQGSREDTKEEVEAFLAAMGRTAYAVLPENVNLQMVEAASSANGGLSPHGELLRYLDDRLSFTFLGQADSATNTSHGSRARSAELQNISWNVIQDYAAGVGTAFEMLARAAIIMNYGEAVEHLIPRQKLLIKNPAMAQQNATRLTALAQAGIPIAAEDMYEQSGAAMPQKGNFVFVNGGYVKFDPTKENEGPSKNNENGESDKRPSSGEGRTGNDPKDNKGSDSEG